jgi:hypothetical protein
MSRLTAGKIDKGLSRCVSPHVINGFSPDVAVELVMA